MYRVDNYNVVPVNLEPDVLSNLFGGVDRSGGPSSADDTNTSVIGRPRRKAGVPARFLCRIYASYDDNPLKICDIMRRNCDNNRRLCLYRCGDMKKTLRKTEFEYRCFQCRKQDDKARSYTRSYDLILHMVNTHKKFPTDAKHNTYYEADGSDFRDATPEEKEKYRLAALTNARNRKLSPLVGRAGARLRQHLRDKVESRTRVTATRDDEMPEPLVTETKEGHTGGSLETRAVVRPAVTP